MTETGIERMTSEETQVSLLSDQDLYLFNEGTHSHLYRKLGSHPLQLGDQPGTYFAVWAPQAQQVWVKGSFNDWNNASHPLHLKGDSGIWEGFIPGVTPGDLYKYRILSQRQGYEVDKADPCAVCQQTPPETASIVWSDEEYPWQDQVWMRHRRSRQALEAPLSIYEMHLGSWRRVFEAEGERCLTYRELGPQLARYILEMGFTHVELMPITEHPFYGSWGYQTTGYFAPTHRYGTLSDFQYLVETLHRHGIGVILDWVPSHFPTDGHGLSYFDGTHLFEHADPRQGFHPDWNSFIFNYGRPEVLSFLISSAFFWLEVCHIDGLRVDGVASMLYLDYSRSEGEWIPNVYGGRENLEAVEFLRLLNQAIYAHFPGVQTMAEESTSWPGVSRPVYVGGLGFGYKWDMGWMHDTLEYFQCDPLFRRYHQDRITFRHLYAFHENFVLSLSHDEVVHGKGSLLAKMPGDTWQKFANLRALLGLMYTQPGKKLVFMGIELAQWQEWSHDRSLDWHLLANPQHQGVQKWLQDLNHLYRREPSLHRYDCQAQGFEWIDCNDTENSVISFLRHGDLQEPDLLVVCNFTPIPRHHYRIGVPRGGFWRELLNGDAQVYGGSGLGNSGGRWSDPWPHHGRPQSLSLILPPLAVILFKWQESEQNMQIGA